MGYFSQSRSIRNSELTSASAEGPFSSSNANRSELASRAASLGASPQSGIHSNDGASVSPPSQVVAGRQAAPAFNDPSGHDPHEKVTASQPAPSLYEGAVQADASSTARLLIVAEIARRNAEELREKHNIWANLNIVQKANLSFKFLWQYKLNILIGVLPFFLFSLLADNHLAKYFKTLSEDFQLTLLASFGLSFIGIMLMLGFVGLIAYIIDKGEPVLIADMFIAPWYKLPKSILPVLGLIGMSMLCQWMCIAAVKFSTHADLVLPLLVFSCMTPLAFCYLFFLADQDDFDLVDSIVEPLKLFASNFFGWLSLIFIVVFACSAAIAVMMLISLTKGVPIVGTSLFFFLGAICSYVFVFGYTAAYAGCLYNQAAARLRLR